MFDRLKRLFGGGEPHGEEVVFLDDEPPAPRVGEEKPPEPEHYLGSAPLMEEKIEWKGNINAKGWDIARYPGHSIATDPETGAPNRIVDAMGRTVADVDAQGNIKPSDTWFG